METDANKDLQLAFEFVKYTNRNNKYCQTVDEGGKDFRPVPAVGSCPRGRQSRQFDGAQR